MDTKKIFEEIDRLYPEYLDILEDVVRIKSPTNRKDKVDEVGRYFIALAKAHGWAVEVSPDEVAGDVVCITLNPDAKAAPVVFSGHIDTVHPIGKFHEPVVWRDEEKMYGPGVYDCKGGVVASFLAMDALDRCGFRERPVMLLIQTDEEVGSSISNHRTINYICERAKGAVAFLNVECWSGSTVVLIRKGILRYKFTVHGIARHSSLCYLAANAVTEAAHKIIELEKMKDKEGLTCNCGVIHGGTVANSVADLCEFTADIRFRDEEQLRLAREKVREIAEHTTVEGCSCEVEEMSLRPAMPRCERNFDLLNKINEISAEAGLPILEARTAFGGSDAAYVTLAGIPCVDSIGIVGEWAHSVKEYAVMKSLAQSAKYQAAVAAKI